MKMLLAAALLAGSFALAHADDAHLEFVGNHGVSSADLRAAVAARSPQPVLDAAGVLDQATLDRDLLLVSVWYWDHGYATVKLDTPVLDRARGTISIPIVEGPVFTLRAVAFGGEMIGSAEDHLANIRVRAGDTFSRTRIVEDREKLIALYQARGYAHANVMPMTKLDPVAHTIALEFDVTRGKTP